MHADLEKLVAKKKIPEAFAARLDKFSPGNYVVHKSWGVGKVKEWNLPENSIVINFESKPDHQMELKFAFNLLTSLPQGHYLIACFEDPQGIWPAAKADPLTLVRLVLNGNFSGKDGEDGPQPIAPEDVEKNLKGRVVPEGDWKSWWEKARKAMRDKSEFILPTRRGELIALRGETMSPASALLEDYKKARDLRTCVRLLDAAKPETLKDDHDVVLELVAALEKDIEEGGANVKQQILELIIVRDELIDALLKSADKDKDGTPVADQEDEGIRKLMAAIPDMTTLDSVLSGISSEEIVAFIGDVPAARQKKIYEALPDAHNGQWLSYATNIFLFGGSKAIGEVAKFIIVKGEGEQLYQDIRNGISRQSLPADVLVWICRERKGAAKPVFTLALGSAIMNAIERDASDGGPNKGLRLRNLLVEDKQLAPDLIRNVTESEARPFAKAIYDSASLHDLDRNLLLANMMRVHHGLQEIVLSRTKVQEKQQLYVSIESYNQRKAEYDELVNVRIPKNKQDLTVTRAEGDLRENGGYQDAKATRQVLMRRSEELARNLAQAHPTDFKDVDTSRSGMGTYVTVVDPEGQEAVFTILGAWDADPDNRVIPYTSKLGQKLTGHAVGDVIKLPFVPGEKPVKLTVKAIAAVNP